jgi:hypothetical protein
MVLHFPVVLILLYILWVVWFSKQIQTKRAKDMGDILLLIAACSAVITALFGLLLSKEGGYGVDVLSLHKYTGAALSFLSFIWYVIIRKLENIRFANTFMSMLMCLLVFVTGDLGAGITHGDNYLLAPVLEKKEPQQVTLEDAVVFTHMIEPILQSKCISCHNNKKAKGELIMETTAELLKGGKDGALWDTTNVDASLLLKRIHLPEADEKHMPPEGKLQLSREEADILYYWIKKGASFTSKVAELPANDSLRLLAADYFKPSTEDIYDFAAADEATIKQLSNNNRVVVPLSLTSPALAVDFYNSENFKPESLKELLKLKGQVVTINLAHMPVTDEEVSTLAQFISLRKLNLNFTKISGKNLAQLNKLPNLKELSLSGTDVNLNDLDALRTLPKLKDVYVWNTSVTAEAAKKIKANYAVQTGFYSDTVVMKLTPPILQNEIQVLTTSIPLQLKHYINGTTIRYTLDGKDPDSTNSPVYDKNTIIDKTSLLKAKAFKPGWISSDVMEAWFYKSIYTPDSIVLSTPGDDSYKADGAKTLNDHVKSDLNFRNGKWLGYHGNKMEALLMFNKPVKAQKVTLSGIVDIGSYLMPAQSIEVWGGNDPAHLKLLGNVTPQQPIKLEPAYLRGFDCSFAETELKYIKVKVNAVSKLPSWHPGKGEKGWFFIDEIFVN